MYKNSFYFYLPPLYLLNILYIPYTVKCKVIDNFVLRAGKHQVFIIYSTISFVEIFEHTVENTVYSSKKTPEKPDKLAVVDSLNRVINIKSCIKIIQKVIKPYHDTDRKLL